MKRIISMILCILFVAAAFAGCQTKKEEPASPEKVLSFTSNDTFMPGAKDETEEQGEVPPTLPDEENEDLSVTVDSFMEEYFVEELEGIDGVEYRKVASGDGVSVYNVTVAGNDADEVASKLEESPAVKEITDPDDAVIPERDLAAEYKGPVTDDEGNYIVPFDVARPDLADDENIVYADDHILVKTPAEFAGEVGRDLRLCGVSSLERFVASDDFLWYRAVLTSGVAVETALKKVRSLEWVLCAELDYEAATEEDGDPVIYGAGEGSETESIIDRLIGDVRGNALVGNQWYLDACDLQQAWRFLQSKGISAGGASNVVVAVIDTGVDYTHPDLVTSMWTNLGEIPDNGIDDDGNGYVDDVHGVDVIANNGNPMDDHGHGTHVAGIIGAANNKEGIVGVAYNTKIMAVKAGQNTGRFNQSDIAEAIIYAYQNGADVINMSFGGSATSVAIEDALAAAYTSCTLVAAAGNKGLPNEYHPNYNTYSPSYPGAYSYVVGVMSVGPSGIESGFTNWDVYSQNKTEYEVYAPGENILSTFPGGRYAYLNGTSMASPVVAGIAALLRSYYTDRDMYPSRFIAAQLSATSEISAICCNPAMHMPPKYHNIPMVTNAYDALTKLPKPEVHLYDYYIKTDDDYVDSGETVEIGLVLRNRWGMSKDTVVTIDAKSSLGIDNKYVEIINGTVNLGSVGTYNTKSMLTRNEDQTVSGIGDPFIVKISPDCPNDYYIDINVHITYGNGLDEDDHTTYTNGTETFTFTVRNGVIKKGTIYEDEVWTKDNYYIIPESLYIPEGVTVTVEAGTKVQFYSSTYESFYSERRPAILNVQGAFITHGKENEPVVLFPGDLFSDYSVQMSGNVYLNYTIVYNSYSTIEYADHCNFLELMHGMGYWKWNTYSFGTTELRNSIKSCNNSLYNVNSNIVDSIFKNCLITSDKKAIDYCFLNCVLSKIYVHELSNYCYYPDDLFVFDEPIVETEDTQYWIMAFDDSNYTTFYYADYFLNTIGANLACFESKQELDLFNNIIFYNYYISDPDNDYFYYDHYYSSVSIGLYKELDYWINGEPTEEWLKDYCIDLLNDNNNNTYPLASLANGLISKEGYNGAILVEIPIINGHKYTSNEIIEKYNDFLSYMYAQNARVILPFLGNAVLNNSRNASTDNCLKIQSSRTNKTLYLSWNYWNTIDYDLINRCLIDRDIDSTLDDIVPMPILTEPPEDVWPFVVDAYLLNSDGERVDTVGNESVTFVVEFNRDMDTEYGLRVRFGAAEPYAEYEVSGSFVTPRRWEGVYTLKTTIENGTQFFRIEDGRAADDHWLVLCEEPARFGFEIDTTAAMSMTMQGNPTREGIELTWLQDDYETIAGYNIYRAEYEDGLYTKLNSVVIPVGGEYFFDENVEPAKMYYYNFTVVLSDMTETNPSGKIAIRALDTMAPNVYHTPVRTAYTGNNLVINATVTDNFALRDVYLYYRVAGTEEWTRTNMTSFNDKFTALIDASYITLEGLEYYIEATDGINYTRRGSADAPLAVNVITAVDPSSKGDVDGDGAITNRDALMILQAVNDLLNLTEEQFLRADLNDDGELSAVEALRIIKYVVGKVTTVVG